VSSVDEDHNKALIIERLQIRALFFKHSTSIEESTCGVRVQLSSTMVDQPPARQLANAPASAQASTTAATPKSKENLYAMRPILPGPKLTKKEKPKFIFICN